MDREIIDQTLKLLEEPGDVSRNRAFYRFVQPEDQRAFRLYRQVVSLEDELLAAGGQGRVEISRADENRVVVRLENRPLRYIRMSFLPREIFARLSQRLAARGVTLQSALT